MTTDDAPHEHLTMETAADFDERLLDAATSAQIAARVASCPTCAQTLDAVSGTRALLADMPAVAMPADVAERLHAAIAAEAQSAAVPGGAATVTALHRPRRRQPWLPIAAGVAAAGALVFALLPGMSSSKGSTTAAPAAASSSPSALSISDNIPAVASGTDYAQLPRTAIAASLKSAAQVVREGAGDITVTSAGGAAEGSGGAGTSVHDTGASSPAANDAASATPSASAASAPSASTTAFSTPVAGPTSVSGSDSPPAAPGAVTYRGPVLTVPSAVHVQVADLSQYGPLRDKATLDACILRLVDPDAPVPPTAIDYASYAGKPALAVFFTSAKAGQLDVYVVGLDCGPKDNVLAFFRVPAAP